LKIFLLSTAIHLLQISPFVGVPKKWAKHLQTKVFRQTPNKNAIWIATEK
jgi:hypothetical protein